MGVGFDGRRGGGSFPMSWTGPEYTVWGFGGQRSEHDRRMTGAKVFYPSETVREWLRENTTGGFWWDDDGIRFQYERDAVLFKMRWF